MANTQKVMTLADTAQLIAKVHANAAKGVRFEYDSTKGEYGNLAAYFTAHKSPLAPAPGLSRTARCTARNSPNTRTATRQRA